MLKNAYEALASVAQLVEASSHRPKGQEFNSQSGHVPGWWIQSQAGACTRGSRMVFLSHINVSLPLSLSHQCFSPSLSPSLPLTLKSISMSSGEDLKNAYEQKIHKKIIV